MSTLIPLMIGVVVENRRLSSDWFEMLIKVMWAFLFSLVIFIPSLSAEDYDMQGNLEYWPYLFIFFFILLSTIWHEQKVMPQLTEGVSLVHSISIIYWAVDMGYTYYSGTVEFVLISIGVTICVTSIIYAMTKFKLTKCTRLILSIWSSLVMVLLGIDHIYRVFNLDQNMDYPMYREGLEYFLLGVALIFIFQNVLMLIAYLPGKGKFYNSSHLKEISAMNKVHAGRYAKDQIKLSRAMLILVATISIYFLNYIYDLFPANDLIWLVFWIFPYVIDEKDYIPDS